MSRRPVVLAAAALLAVATPLAEITVVADPPVVGAAQLGLDALGTTPGAEERLRTWSTACPAKEEIPVLRRLSALLIPSLALSFCGPDRHVPPEAVGPVGA